VRREQVYFCGEGWTGQITLIVLRKLVRTDSAFRGPFVGLMPVANNRMGWACETHHVHRVALTGFDFGLPILRAIRDHAHGYHDKTRCKARS
jgi:hypothetical protein